MKFLAIIPLLALPVSAQPLFKKVWPFMQAQNTAAAAPTPDKLWLQFTEGSGATATNSAAAGLSNAFVLNATWATGKSGSGYSIDFDGSTSEAWVTNVSFVTNTITLTTWAFFDSTNQANAGCLFELSTNVNYIQRNFRVMCTAAGNLAVLIHGTGDSANFRQETATAPNTNAWVHLGIVLDNSTTAGDVKIYYNAVAQSTTIATDTKNLTGTFLATNLFIGARSTALATRAFLNGKLDDVRIYSGELNSAQLTAVMNDPK